MRETLGCLVEMDNKVSSLCCIREWDLCFWNDIVEYILYLSFTELWSRPTKRSGLKSTFIPFYPQWRCLRLGFPWSLPIRGSSVVHVLDDLNLWTMVLPSFVLHQSPRRFVAIVDRPRVCRCRRWSIGGMVNHFPLHWRSW